MLTFDPHVWLDPANAKAMAAAVAVELAKADPANAAAYDGQCQAFEASLDEAVGQITAELAPVKDKPYIVFHDAYQYFEQRFGLSGGGSISDVSAQAPSAERLKRFGNKLAATKAECVFREPQYDGKVVATVIEGTAREGGVLDPLGAEDARAAKPTGRSCSISPPASRPACPPDIQPSLFCRIGPSSHSELEL